MKELASIFEGLGFEVNDVVDSCILMELIEYTEKDLERIVKMVEYLLKKTENKLKGDFKIGICSNINVTYRTYDLENDLKILGGLINE